MAKSKNSLSLPDNVFGMLAAADERNGFPAGTMQSIMQQETGGQAKYLDDPTTYHYPLNADGKRIAGHTGKVSTAFGPFGILESTGKDPGYGVTPLKDKSLEEQVRFASDYLAARSTGAGGLDAGLAGYGEGTKYAKQVLQRTAVAPASVVLAQAAPVQPVVAGLQDRSTPVEVLAQAPSPEAAPVPAGPNEWTTYLDQLRQSQTQAPVQVADLNYGTKPAGPAPVMQVPDFMAALASLGQQRRPDFNGFGGFAGFGMKAQA